MSTAIRSVIVDDEPHCVDELRDLLTAHHPEIELVGVANHVDAGVQLIQEQEPELLFLDIELYDRTSFELLEQIDYGRYAIVFATAHNQYAVRAFDFEAMAYILKPIEADALAAAIVRANKRIQERSYQESSEDLLRLMRQIQTQRPPDRITISNSEGFHFLYLADITHFASHDGCVIVHTNTDRRVSSAKNLIEYERQLRDYGNFFRCHKSFLVNTNQIVHARPYDLTLSCGTVVPCSQVKWEGLKGRL
ncbi:MAG: LytTR family DNA-binding domain-containing protein [Bacteroidota bacterium]